MISSITETFGAITDFVVWSFIIYGAFQLAMIGGIVVRTFYTMKVIRQVSSLLTELMKEYKNLRKDLQELQNGKS